MEKINVRINQTNLNAVLVYDEDFFLEQWRGAESGRYEANTYRIFDEEVDSETIYIDLGAYIGATCLYVAKTAKHAYGFEPDPVAFKYLKLNYEANPDIKNLNIFPYAIGPKEGVVKIMSRDYGANGGSSLLLKKFKSSWETKMVDLNKFIKEKVRNEKLFIKIDIEGYEYTLVKSMKRTFKQFQPTIFLALHPQIIASSIQGQSILKKIIRRFVLFRAHFNLFRSIRGFNHLSRVDLTTVSLRSLLKEVILTGGLKEENKELLIKF